MPAAPRLVAALADRYAFERELGQGGMATVYLADDLRHHRKVAIKVLRPELAATIGPDRFFREIRIAAQLQHPHVLPLLESGEAEGFLFYVMPFVDGQSLRERLAKTGELPVHEAVKLLVEIVDALSYAHARGVVHRDVKPDNVMLSGRHALVMDFGVAKAVSEASGRNQLTTAGVALGTPAYMAPEQAAADPNLDHRVDIYAVGAMAYELLTGRPPFVGGTPQQVLASHVTQPPEPVSRYRPGIPPALEAVIMRCLAKRPADRFQSADELLAQLEPLMTPSGGMTPTSTRPIEGWKPEGKSKRWIGGVAAALIAIALLVWALRPDASRAAHVQLDREQLTFTGNAWSPSLSPDGQRIAFAERRCDSVGLCTMDLVVQDVGGAGAATVLSGAYNVWQTRWTADGRYLLVGASFAEGWGNYAVSTLGGQRRELGPGAATLLGNGDTALVMWALPSDSIAWIRRVGTASGIVYDSIPWPKALGAYPAVEATPDGRWLLLLSSIDSRTASRAVVTIADRSGSARDSIVFPHDRVFQVQGLPGSRSIALFSAVEGAAGEFDVIVYPLDDDGQVGERPDTVARQLQLGSPSVGYRGELVALSGPVVHAVWSFRRDDLRSTSFPLRRLAASRSIQVTGSISNDGREIFLVRDIAARGPRLRQLSIMPADSGPERLLGSPLQVVDWDWGEGEIIVAVTHGDSVAISSLDPASGRLRELKRYHGPQFGTLEAVRGGGFVHFPPTADRLDRIARPGLPDTTFRFPPAFGVLIWAEPSPDGTAVATAGFDRRGDSLLINRVSLTDGSHSRLATFYADDLDAPRWLGDGTILLPIEETAWTLALYSLPSTGGPLTRHGLLPLFPATYRFSADGLRGIVRSQERSMDVVVMRNFADVVK